VPQTSQRTERMRTALLRVRSPTCRSSERRAAYQPTCLTPGSLPVARPVRRGSWRLSQTTRVGNANGI